MPRETRRMKETEYDETPDKFNFFVVVRLRPDSMAELKRGALQVVSDVTDTTLTVTEFHKNPTADHQGYEQSQTVQHFAFDAVYGEDADQEMVAEPLVNRVIPQVLKGVSASIMAYGATGSGKTYTMMGSDIKDAQGKPLGTRLDGVAPMCINELFSQATEIVPNCTISVFMSMFEIYNEGVFDLLVHGKSSIASRTALSVKELKNDRQGVLIEGLTEVEINGIQDARRLLERGMNRRTQFNTVYNERSSRSHALIRLRIIVMDPGDETLTPDLKYSREATRSISTLTLVDLAGSERYVPQNGDIIAGQLRMREAQNINRSLLSLKQCMDALAEGGRSHVPFRNSKLTLVLKDSLKTGCNVLIANIVQSILPKLDNSPYRTVEEIFNTLRYAQTARSVVTAAKQHIEALERHVDEYRAEVAALRAYIASETEIKEALVNSINKLNNSGELENNDRNSNNNENNNNNNNDSINKNISDIEKNLEYEIKDLKAWVEKQSNLHNRRTKVIANIDEMLRLKQLLFLAAEPGVTEFATNSGNTLKMLLLELVKIERELKGIENMKLKLNGIGSALLRVLAAWSYDDSLQNQESNTEISLKKQMNKAIKLTSSTLIELVNIAGANEDPNKRRVETDELMSRLVNIFKTDCPLVNADRVIQASTDAYRATKEHVSAPSMSQVQQRSKSESGMRSSRAISTKAQSSTKVIRPPASASQYSMNGRRVVSPSGGTSVRGQSASNARANRQVAEKSNERYQNKSGYDRGNDFYGKSSLNPRENSSLKSRYDYNGRLIPRSRSYVSYPDNRRHSNQNKMESPVTSLPRTGLSSSSSLYGLQNRETRAYSTSTGLKKIPIVNRSNIKPLHGSRKNNELSQIIMAQNPDMYSNENNKRYIDSAKEGTRRTKKGYQNTNPYDFDIDLENNSRGLHSSNYRQRKQVSSSKLDEKPRLKRHKNNKDDEIEYYVVAGQDNNLVRQDINQFEPDASFVEPDNNNNNKDNSANYDSNVPNQIEIIEGKKENKKRRDETALDNEEEFTKEHLESNDEDKLKEKKDAELKKLEEEINRRLQQRKLDREKKLLREKRMKEREEKERLKNMDLEANEPFIALTEGLYTLIKKKFERDNRFMSSRPSSGVHNSRKKELSELEIYDPSNTINSENNYGITLNYKDIMLKKQSNGLNAVAKKNLYADIEMNSWDSDDEIFIIESGGLGRTGSASRNRRSVSKSQNASEPSNKGSRSKSKQSKPPEQKSATPLSKSRSGSGSNSRVQSPSLSYRTSGTKI